MLTRNGSHLPKAGRSADTHIHTVYHFSANCSEWGTEDGEGGRGPEEAGRRWAGMLYYRFGRLVILYFSTMIGWNCFTTLLHLLSDMSTACAHLPQNSHVRSFLRSWEGRVVPAYLDVKCVLATQNAYRLAGLPSFSGDDTTTSGPLRLRRQYSWSLANRLLRLRTLMLILSIIARHNAMSACVRPWLKMYVTQWSICSCSSDIATLNDVSCNDLIYYAIVLFSGDLELIISLSRENKVSISREN